MSTNLKILLLCSPWKKLRFEYFQTLTKKSVITSNKSFTYGSYESFTKQMGNFPGNYYSKIIRVHEKLTKIAPEKYVHEIR